MPHHACGPQKTSCGRELILSLYHGGPGDWINHQAWSAVFVCWAILVACVYCLKDAFRYLPCISSLFKFLAYFLCFLFEKSAVIQTNKDSINCNIKTRYNFQKKDDDLIIYLRVGYWRGVWGIGGQQRMAVIWMIRSMYEMKINKTYQRVNKSFTNLQEIFF